MTKQLVTVVIPIHLEEPSELEKISLAQTLAVLHKHPITFMAPTHLNTSWYEAYCQGKASINIERFAWKGHEAFSELLIDPTYYQRFSAYEYILICHMDAFVFRDELEKWCRAGYDYIGAVIYHPQWKGVMDKPLRKALGFGSPEYFGNGGFSLKKVSTYYHITSKYRFYINLYNWVRKARKKQLLEDLFVTLHFPKLSTFKIPPMAIAENFGAAYEVYEEENLPFNNHQISTLPFGIHGWIQFQQDFWKPVIRQFGYSI
jgi:hypothetical protein